MLLLKLKLEPIILQNLPGCGDTIIEKLEKLTAADYACVLITPDDEGRKKSASCEDEGPLRPRARQIVILELGMVLARLGRSNVSILLKGTEIERPSDTDGMLRLQFKTDVKEVLNPLAANLRKAGFNLSINDLLPG